MLPWQRNPCADCKEPNSAQLGGIPYHSPKLHPVRVVVWACGRGQTDSRVWLLCISRRPRLTRNVIYNNKLINFTINTDSVVEWSWSSSLSVADCCWGHSRRDLFTCGEVSRQEIDADVTRRASSTMRGCSSATICPLLSEVIVLGPRVLPCLVCTGCRSTESSLWHRLLTDSSFFAYNKPVSNKILFCLTKLYE